MKSAAISRFVMVAAVAALVVVGGSTGAWAQVACPDTSPNFTPDFSSAASQACLTRTGNTGAGQTSAAPPAVYPGFFAPAPGAPASVAKVLRLTPNSPGGQSGSAWFTTQQAVAGTFSTTFTFQLSGSSTPGDGFAFVIQNFASNALDPGNDSIGNQTYFDGCSLGFGQSSTCNTTNPTTGIPNSVAVEFNTYKNPDNAAGPSPPNTDPSNSDVSIQSCGTNNNSVDPGVCRWGVKDLTLLSPAINLADGLPHTVSISFTPSGACSSAISPGCPGFLDVVLDNIDLFPATTPGNPAGVAFDIASIGLTGTGTAWVGFTGATGGATDNQDILNWTFSPNTQSAATSTTTQALLPFSGGVANNGFDYTTLLNSPPAGQLGVASTTVQVKRIPIDRNSCNRLVQQTFPLAQCFVFQNADGNGARKAVLFELTCPTLNAQGTCDQDDERNQFFATLGTDFIFQNSDNPGFNLLNSTIGPYIGALKGDTGLPDEPCTTDATHPTLKFLSNQIVSANVFQVDPGIGTKQKANPGGSCWVITYATVGELPPAISISLSPAKSTYKKGDSVTATYTCSNPRTSQGPNSAKGPYLTAASCTQASGHQTPNSCVFTPLPGGGLTCSGSVDTSHSSPLPQAFTVKALDSAGNVNVNAVLYKVSN